MIPFKNHLPPTICAKILKLYLDGTINKQTAIDIMQGYSFAYGLKKFMIDNKIDIVIIDEKKYRLDNCIL